MPSTSITGEQAGSAIGAAGALTGRVTERLALACTRGGFELAAPAAAF